ADPRRSARAPFRVLPSTGADERRSNRGAAHWAFPSPRTQASGETPLPPRRVATWCLRPDAQREHLPARRPPQEDQEQGKIRDSQPHSTLTRKRRAFEVFGQFGWICPRTPTFFR